MAEHRNDKSRETQIIVKQCNPIKSGDGRDGSRWTMYQLVATKPDGTPIPQNLRTFDEVPVNEVVDVNVTPFVSETYGTSYTVKLKEPSESQRELEALKRRVEAIELKLGMKVGGQPLTPPPPPAGPVATPPMPPPPERTEAPPDEIPF